MAERTNWDDLRFVLAVAEEGSVSAAARRLAVNHATVLRRVAAYEEASGVALFDRTARGYVVPGARRDIIEAAREVERAVESVARRLRGAQAPLSGEVRVTSTDTLCQTVLPVIVAALRAEAPDLSIQLLCTNAHLDLGRTHADITIRPTDRLPDDLAGEAVARLGFGAFRSADLTGDLWLGLVGPLARSKVALWLAENAQARPAGVAADSFVALRELAAAGHGIAILPSILGRADARLEEVHGVLPNLSVPVWVASHVDLADVPRIAGARQVLARALRGVGAGLAGEGGRTDRP